MQDIAQVASSSEPVAQAAGVHTDFAPAGMLKNKEAAQNGTSRKLQAVPSQRQDLHFRCFAQADDPASCEAVISSISQVPCLRVWAPARRKPVAWLPPGGTIVCLAFSEQS